MTENETKETGDIIDITPTWTAILPIIIMTLEHGTSERAKDSIKAELRRMARYADLYVASQKADKEKAGN